MKIAIAELLLFLFACPVGAFNVAYPSKYLLPRPPTLLSQNPALSEKPLAWRKSNHNENHNKRPFVVLSMGFLDNIRNAFLEEREGDFIKLNDPKDAQAFGPGPLVVLYNVPPGVTNDEIQDMLEDGAPQAFAKGVKLYRFENFDTKCSPDPLLDKPMQEALAEIANGKFQATVSSKQSLSSVPSMGVQEQPIVVTLFSGFANDEMMATYNILGNEIFQESQWSAACAKAVPKAMEKPLRQVLEEIGGDHRDAMRMAEEQERP